MKKEKIIRLVETLYEKYSFIEEGFEYIDIIKEQMVARISTIILSKFPNKMFSISFETKTKIPIECLDNNKHQRYELTCKCEIYEEVLNDNNDVIKIFNNFNFLENGDNNV